MVSSRLDREPAAGVAPAAPAAFSGENYADTIGRLAAQGLSDKEIAELLGKTRNAICCMRILHKIPSGERAPAFGQSRGDHEARYAEFFAANGAYPSFTDAQIARYERRWALAHPKRAPAVIDVAPILYGDPKPGRAA